MRQQHPPAPSATGRRRFIALAAAGVTTLGAGCRPPWREKSEPPEPDPDVVATAAALRRTETLLANYQAAAAAHPKLAEQLRPFEARHLEHRTQLRARLPKGHRAKKRASPKDTSASTTPSGTTPSATQDSRSSATMLTQLSAAERDAADAFATAALDAGTTLAPVLASMSACAHAHVPLLAEVHR